MSEQRPPYGTPNLLASLREAIAALEAAEKAMLETYTSTEPMSRQRMKLVAIYESIGEIAMHCYRQLEIAETAALEAQKDANAENA